MKAIFFKSHHCSGCVVALPWFFECIKDPFVTGVPCTHIFFTTMDVAEHEALAIKLEIRSLPTVVFVDDNDVSFGSIIPKNPKQFREEFTALIAKSREVAAP